MEKHHIDVMIDEAAVDNRIKELGKQISRDRSEERRVGKECYS